MNRHFSTNVLAICLCVAAGAVVIAQDSRASPVQANTQAMVVQVPQADSNFPAQVGATNQTAIDILAMAAKKATVAKVKEFASKVPVRPSPASQ